ncbi:MAG: AAA family ATPase [Gammaproteobacteria bacterium]|nr:AAA family ATPase [Gammaproteobacteria bacterium]
MSDNTLRSTIGPPAEGTKRFLKRPNVIRKIRRKLKDGNHLLLSAPRRIGKTSLLKFLLNNPQEDQIVKYMIVQSVSSQNEFFKQLLNELINDEQIYSGLERFINHASKSLKGYISRVKRIELTGSVVFSDDEQINYYESVNDILNALDDEGKNIIILVDEFPDALTNIYENDPREGIQFLQRHREMRDLHNQSRIQFVYTGSTGLKHVVQKIGDIDLPNNLQEVYVPPLDHEEAHQLVRSLTRGKQEDIASFDIQPTVVDYLLERITWKLPYYIQIIVEKLFDEFETEPHPIGKEEVDYALAALVRSGSEYADYFQHWKSRLAKAFKGNDYRLAIDILNLTARNGEISYPAYFNLEQKHKIADKNYVLNVLRYDGYLAPQDDNEKLFGFNSILLREWWSINVLS